jgi:hypothetical protein
MNRPPAGVPKPNRVGTSFFGDGTVINPRLFLLVFLAVLIPLGSLGQTASVTASTSASLAEALPKPKLDLRSPQKTMRAFLEAMSAVKTGKAEKMVEAQACLNLDDIPATEREARSLEICQKLYEVLTTFTFKIDAIPDELSEKTWQFFLGKEKEVQISFLKTQNDVWQFSYQRTLRKVEDTHKKIVEAAIGRTPSDSITGEGLRSPRDTMKTFLESMEKSGGAGENDLLKASI